jgi:hypothetical protein
MQEGGSHYLTALLGRTSEGSILACGSGFLLASVETLLQFVERGHAQGHSCPLVAILEFERQGR